MAGRAARYHLARLWRLRNETLSRRTSQDGHNLAERGPGAVA